MASIAVTGQAKSSEYLRSSRFRLGRSCRGHRHFRGSRKSVCVCVAQTHKMAVAITGSAADGGRTTRLGTTGLTPDLEPPDLDTLRTPDLGPPDLGPLATFS